jgi:Domain of unknown function (DUF4956)
MAVLSELPVWRNLVARTVLWYLVMGWLFYWLRDVAPVDAGFLAGPGFDKIASGAIPVDGQVAPTPTGVTTIVAMLTAFVTALPVAWVYTLTRRKKGFQQSVVQTYLILPVVAAAIVVMVKTSLALAFSLGGIVAAVRFRTSLDDSKDAAGIFVVIGIGMAAGVAPEVAWVISIGFNLLMLFLWQTDFGKPVALEGKLAERKLERALATANRTGMFLARMDDEVLKSMSSEQLEALADRAWRRRKRNDPDLADDEMVTEERPRYERMLRLRAVDVDRARALVEPKFGSLFKHWKYLGSVKENDLRVLEYGVTMADTVTPGVVSDDLGTIPDSPLRGVELR